MLKFDQLTWWTRVWISPLFWPAARNVSTHLRQLGHEFNEAFEQVNSAQ